MYRQLLRSFGRAGLQTSQQSWPNAIHRRISYAIAAPETAAFSPLAALKPGIQGFWVQRTNEGDATEQHWVDALWLRDRCTCDKCVNPGTKQKQFSTGSIPSTLAPKTLRADGRRLEVDWANDVDDAEHTSLYDIESLFHDRDAAIHDLSAGRQVLWDQPQMDATVTSGGNVVSFHDIASKEAAFVKLLKSIRDYGLAFVTDVPRSEQSIEQLAELIGPLRHTFYGRTWDVKEVKKAQNVAYTAVDLELHMDLLYMKQPPGLQLLHCIQASGTGGVSTFSDSFRAAQSLFKDPDGRSAFDVLASYPVSYHYNHPGRAFFDTKPTFEVNELRDTWLADRGLKTSKEMPLLKNVNWSPPFQAPFTADPHLPGSDAFRNYQKAAAAFSGLVNQPSARYEKTLGSGECVIFNNRRVLHGRTAFVSGTEARFLKGAYLDTDDFESQLRQRDLHIHA